MKTNDVEVSVSFSSIYKANDISNVHVKSSYFYTMYKVHMNDVSIERSLCTRARLSRKPASYKVHIEDNK